MHRPAASAKCLVVLSRVESQGAKQHTVGGDDADVGAGDQEVDLSVSVPGPDCWRSRRLNTPDREI